LLGIRGPSNSGRCSQSPRSNGASTPDAALVLRAGRAGRSQRRRFSRAGSRRTGSGAGRALGRQGDHAGVADLASASAAMRSPARSWPGESYPLVTCFCPGAKSDRGQRRRVGQTLCVRRRLAGGRCRDQHGRSLGARGSVRRTAGRTESRDWWSEQCPVSLFGCEHDHRLVVVPRRPGRSTAGSSRRSTILSRRPTAQQLTRAARAHTSGATDPPDATSEPPPLVDDPRRSRSRSRASRSDPLGSVASRVRHADRQPRRGRPHQRHRPRSMGGGR
jgi:hypothetical protein